MKALLCKHHGPPEDLVLEDIDPPRCGAKGVRIAVRAAGVNFPDVLLIEGKYQFKPPLPFAPGGEVAGDVIEVGEQVTRFQVGERVLAFTGWAGFAEQAVAPEDKCLRLPESMDYQTGAAFAVTYGTSYHALVQRAGLRAGEWLLVHGATGGVGTAAIEIGKALGARIIATGGDDEKLDRICASYGIEHAINYRREPSFKDAVKSLTSGKGADVIYDPVGGEVFEQSLRCINWNGRLLVVGFACGTIPSAKANLILLKGCSVVGVYWGMFATREPESNRANFEALFEMHRQGRLAPTISRRFPLERGGEAIRALMDRTIVGKAVVIL
jgi:NADPH2:quinone reductase